MGFSKLIAWIFGIIFIILLYFILMYALKIMAKDVKGGGKKRVTPANRKTLGLEVVSTSEGSGVKIGAVIPIRGTISFGRKDDNEVCINDFHISGNHAIVTPKSNGVFLEDLGSTNGTFVNGNQITGRVKLFPRDEVRMGNTKFIVIN